MTSEVNGCLYCGELERGHAQRWMRGLGYHAYILPTDALRKARMLLRREKTK